MTPIKSTMLAMLVTTFSSGCIFLPPNHITIISPKPTAAGRQLVRFTRGIHIPSNDGSIALLVSPSAALLFDVQGKHNRFELMLQDGPQFTLYSRIGQRSAPLTNMTKASPAGIDLERTNAQLRGYIDVFLSRSNNDPYDPKFEHYPRTVRVVGYLMVPSPDSTTVTEFIADSLFPEPEPQKLHTPATLPTTRPITNLQAELDGRPWILEPGSSLEKIANQLPRLAHVDMKTLVPTYFTAPLPR